MTAGSNSSEEDQGSTLESRAAAAGDNWQKLQDEKKAKKEREERKKQIKKERDAVARNARLKGKGLADDDDDADAASWIKGLSKRAKKNEKEVKLKAEREAAKKKAEYTAADLAGVKVAHELDELDVGAEQIFTIKDAEIGSDSGEDELENVNLRDQAKTQKRLDAKKKKPVYDPFAIDETGENTVLAKYDDEIDGPKSVAFTLDGRGSTREATLKAKDEDKNKSKGVFINLDMLKDDAPISDYKEPSEIKIRKPKKGKKTKNIRKRATDEDDILPVAKNEADSMDLDSGFVSGSRKRVLDDEDYMDDEDLQSQLANQRRQALKKRKKFRPEDVAQQMREEVENIMDGIEEGVGIEGLEEQVGVVMDETTEFVSNMEPVDEEEEEEEKAARKRINTSRSQHSSGNPDSEQDEEMQESYGAAQEAEEAAERAQREASTSNLDTGTGLDEQDSLTGGIGSTLAMLRKRGLVGESDGSEKSTAFRERQEFQAHLRALEEELDVKARQDRENDRASGRLDNMSNRERDEYAQKENEKREVALQMAKDKLFKKAYKPNFELSYHDDQGYSLNQKEAFKHMSHQFHGKTPGKGKTEKAEKKREKERERERKSVLGSTAQGAMGDRAKRTGQAHIRMQ